MKIIPFIPFRIDRNLFLAYDECMSLLDPEDYGILCDHDTVFTSNDWMSVIKQGIEDTSGVLLTGYTNRVACRWQVLEDGEGLQDDYRRHRELGESMEAVPPEDRTGRALLSGFIIIIKKSWWDTIKGFIQTRQGCLGLDNEMHRITRDLGEKIWQLNFYMYHWYRGGTNDKSHLL